mmetsp:Transcript_16097/g.24999  ORF Transcript_16097/g.24999 Transcript_16097/m.24999 type:complete len:94 (+) Transcript_16097:993-1274(+)
MSGSNEFAPATEQPPTGGQSLPTSNIDMTSRNNTYILAEENETSLKKQSTTASNHHRATCLNAEDRRMLATVHGRAVHSNNSPNPVFSSLAKR